ncbi:MAG TPA: nucleotide exchange factor GrpE [Nitrospiraceae bacterium]|nr:nucleotide exchange factor GrpE [Nitrospiraceae bacterium]
MTDQEYNPNTIDDLTSESAETAESAGDENTNTSADDLKRLLEAKDVECKTAHDKYLRLAAEFDNYKRLAQRDQREQIKFGNEHILKELLPVVDNLERAIKSAKDNGDTDALTQGVELTLKQFVGVLTKFGVTPVDSVGRPFDPATQQAVAQVESEKVPEHCVVEEFQKGYLLHDRILRAAMVSVSKGISTDA